LEQGLECREADVFFFQAEDGIRDRNVTGVQTCALPIYAKASFSQTVKHSGGKAQSGSGTLYIKKENKYRIETGGQIIITDGSTRSEERRVGKERRSRRAREP